MQRNDETGFANARTVVNEVNGRHRHDGHHGGVTESDYRDGERDRARQFCCRGCCRSRDGHRGDVGTNPPPVHGRGGQLGGDGEDKGSRQFGHSERVAKNDTDAVEVWPNNRSDGRRPDHHGQVAPAIFRRGIIRDGESRLQVHGTTDAEAQESEKHERQ